MTGAYPQPNLARSIFVALYVPTPADSAVRMMNLASACPGFLQPQEQPSAESLRVVRDTLDHQPMPHAYP